MASLKNINKSVISGSDKHEYTEEGFKKAVSENNWVSFTEKQLEESRSEIESLIRKGNTSALDQQESAKVQKAYDDLERLEEVSVFSKSGSKYTMYVRVADHKAANRGDEIKYKHPVTGDLHKGVVTKIDGIKISVASKLKDETPINRDIKDYHVVEIISKAKLSDNIEMNNSAYERHLHNMRVQRMGKDASLKHIASKYGDHAAEFCKSKHESELSGLVSRVEEKLSKSVSK